MARQLLALLLVAAVAINVSEAWRCTGTILSCSMIERWTGACPCRDFQQCPGNPCVCNVAACCKTQCTGAGATCTPTPVPGSCSVAPLVPTQCVLSTCASQCRNNECGTNTACGTTGVC